jgi:hypothetical protein
MPPVPNQFPTHQAYRVHLITQYDQYLNGVNASVQSSANNTDLVRSFPNSPFLNANNYKVIHIADATVAAKLCEIFACHSV